MSVLDNRPENPLTTNYGLKLRIGLAIALFLVCGAFQLQWATGAESDSYTGVDFDEPETFLVELTTKKKELPEPNKVLAKQQKPTLLPTDIIINDQVEDVSELPDMDIDVTDDVVVEDPVFVEPKVDNKVHTWVEHMPQFPGGDKALMDYLRRTPFCSFALENDIEGTVSVSFVIDQNGEVTSVHIDRGVTKCMNDMVVAHIKAMPKWTPGKMGDKPVMVKIGVPIRFAVK